MSCAVYGIGNILLGDDGVGPAVIRCLADRGDLPPDVILADLGTPSLDLPAYLAGHGLVVFVDAFASDEAPGTLRNFSREQLMAAPRGIRISPHEPSVSDALVVLDFAGNAPDDVVMIGIVPLTLDGGITMSPDVARAVPRAADAVVAELAKRGISGTRAVEEGVQWPS